MNCITFLLICCCVVDKISGQLITNTGSYSFSSYSTKASRRVNVRFMMCLSSVPNHIRATAIATDHSLPHKFNLTVLEVKIGDFVAELERTDQHTGWDTMIIVDWKLYITEKSVFFRNKIIWIPDLAQRVTSSNKEASEYCAENGGTLVDIEDKEMYDVVYHYIRNNFKFGTISYARFWLGSSYNSTLSF
uniref:uncharacterized protein LOC108949493 n=1 Tax=Ciona intestinalis TaxID=7719 RepID=UPI00089DD1A5|nr:uncharacterized protein LOC108949493 [Ciona intestinalis]|eukprot:XP_018667397.1 uncharacterized protein LOC108949493 [Ciona intestinalis]